MVNKKIEKHVDLLIDRYPILDVVQQDILEAYMILEV